MGNQKEKHIRNEHEQEFLKDYILLRKVDEVLFETRGQTKSYNIEEKNMIVSEVCLLVDKVRQEKEDEHWDMNEEEPLRLNRFTLLYWGMAYQFLNLI